jgi:hypothetical protein
MASGRAVFQPDRLWKLEKCCSRRKLAKLTRIAGPETPRTDPLPRAVPAATWGNILGEDYPWASRLLRFHRKLFRGQVPALTLPSSGVIQRSCRFGFCFSRVSREFPASRPLTLEVRLTSRAAAYVAGQTDRFLRLFFGGLDAALQDLCCIFPAVAGPSPFRDYSLGSVVAACRRHL